MKKKHNSSKILGSSKTVVFKRYQSNIEIDYKHFSKDDMHDNALEHFSSV